jgi:hypothetical protein
MDLELEERPEGRYPPDEVIHPAIIYLQGRRWPRGQRV